MSNVNWDNLSKLGQYRAVIDPEDDRGLKNALIDRIQWNALRKPLSGTRHLLDFGCGVGRFASRMKAMGIKYTGIDTSQGMVEKARAFNNDDQMNFQHFDGSKIPFADASFDTVFCCGVFIYVLKTPRQHVLSEIYRVLKPKGRLILIEQASISGRKSDSATNVLTEADYIASLSEQFEIKQIHKVRSPDFSHLGVRLTESRKFPEFLFRCGLGVLAQHEANRVAKAPEAYFKTTSYYDFLLEAVRKT